MSWKHDNVITIKYGRGHSYAPYPTHTSLAANVRLCNAEAPEHLGGMTMSPPNPPRWPHILGHVTPRQHNILELQYDNVLTSHLNILEV